MKQDLVQGSGQVTATTQFALLNPAALHGATSFYFDFYIRGVDAAADGIWQMWDGGAYVNMAGASGVAGVGDSEWLQRVEVDATSTGLVQILRTAGTLDYWYINSSGGALPTVVAASGSTTADVEFLLDVDKQYTFTTDGSFTWEYWDGVAWVAFAGSSSEFTEYAPAFGRVRLNVTAGTVTFAIRGH